jgi:hypothetical protein
MSMMGGAFGTTALPPRHQLAGHSAFLSGVGRPMLDIKPAIDPEAAKIDKMINSICRGC